MIHMLSASSGKNGKKKSVFSFFDATHQMMHMQSAPQLLQLKKKSAALHLQVQSQNDCHTMIQSALFL